MLLEHLLYWSTGFAMVFMAILAYAVAHPLTWMDYPRYGWRQDVARYEQCFKFLNWLFEHVNLVGGIYLAGIVIITFYHLLG